jgi:transcriptional regulator with XRE-family HTH domain
MSDELPALARNVKRVREARDFSRDRLAMAVGTTRSTVASIELARVVNPGVYTLYPIALALGTSMETLMGVSPIAERQRVRNHSASLDRETLRAARALLAKWEAVEANETTVREMWEVCAELRAALDGD